MLAGCSFDSGAAGCQPKFLRLMNNPSPLFHIFFHKTVSGLLCHSRNGTGLEHMGFAKQLLRVAVCLVLILAGKVQVDIRRLIAVKA